VNVIIAFTAEQVSRLTGLSDHQLRYWDDTGFFKPSLADEPKRPYGRIYSFRDVVGLRTIAIMRNRYGIPLQGLRKLGGWLAEHYDQPWSTLRFYVVGKDVYFGDSSDGTRRAGRRPDQTVITIEMNDVAEVTGEEADRLRRREADEIGRIVQHRYVSHNSPVVDGTRIRTEAIWRFHDAGYDNDAIIEQYPRLTKKDVEAALDYERRRRQRVAS
jgi:uncharacterized protein (DUF433 family)